MVHIFQTADCEEGVLSDVVNLLSGFPGPLRFRAEPELTSFSRFAENPKEPFKKNVVLFETEVSSSMKFENRFQKRNAVDWEHIFEKCTELRIQHDIGKDSFVILLMAANNSMNWFAAGSPDLARDLFVHTEDWDFFVGSDRRFPIAYQIASGILKRMVFRDYADLNNFWHYEPRGCMLDFCEKKQQVALKVRTGDVCPDCLNLFLNRKVPGEILAQVFRILDGIREQMLFKSRFQLNQSIPALHIKGQLRDLVFPSMGNLSIHLDPLEKVLYLFFLRHPEGVKLSFLQDFRDEILADYQAISSSDSRETMEQRVSELINPRSNTCSEKISKIKKKIVDTLGADLAKAFIITGTRGDVKKISVNRSLVVFEE